MDHTFSLTAASPVQTFEKYRPGLHILGEIVTLQQSLLLDHAETKEFFTGKISEYGLNSLGEVWHNFENGGYTGVICLTESHIAIHTWPEYNIVTFDVYLSNFRKTNDEKARSLFNDTIQFFNAESYTRNEVAR